MNFQEIHNSLTSLSDQELSILNRSACDVIKRRRAAKAAQAATVIRFGQEYIIQGVRPEHLNGTRVKVTKVMRVRAQVVDAITGRLWGTVPLTCLVSPAA